MIIIKNSLRTSIYQSKTFFVIENKNDTVYVKLINYIINIVNKEMNMAFSKLESSIMTLSGKLEIVAGDSFIFFEVDKEFYPNRADKIFICDFVSYNTSQESSSQPIPWKKAIIIDYENFIYKVHMIYGDGDEALLAIDSKLITL